MKPDQPLRTHLRYCRTLVASGVSGLRSGRDSYLNGHPLSNVLTQSARASLSLAAVGASAGLLPFCLNVRRGDIPKAVTLGVIGSAIGFLASFVWETRGLTGGMSRSALKQLGALRDEHWLERHPIDYA